MPSVDSVELVILFSLLLDGFSFRITLMRKINLNCAYGCVLIIDI